MAMITHGSRVRQLVERLRDQVELDAIVCALAVIVDEEAEKSLEHDSRAIELKKLYHLLMLAFWQCGACGLK